MKNYKVHTFNVCVALGLVIALLCSACGGGSGTAQNTTDQASAAQSAPPPLSETCARLICDEVGGSRSNFLDCRIGTIRSCNDDGTCQECERNGTCYEMNCKTSPPIGIAKTVDMEFNVSEDDTYYEEEQ